MDFFLTVLGLACLDEVNKVIIFLHWLIWLKACGCFIEHQKIGWMPCSTKVRRSAKKRFPTAKNSQSINWDKDRPKSSKTSKAETSLSQFFEPTKTRIPLAQIRGCAWKGYSLLASVDWTKLLLFLEFQAQNWEEVSEPNIAENEQQDPPARKIGSG